MHYLGFVEHFYIPLKLAVYDAINVGFFSDICSNEFIDTPSLEYK